MCGIAPPSPADAVVLALQPTDGASPVTVSICTADGAPLLQQVKGEQCNFERKVACVQQQR